MSDLLNFFADNASLLADKTLEHLAICALAIAIAAGSVVELLGGVA